MQIKEDWIVRNWDFLKARRMKEIVGWRFKNIFRFADAPTTAKFYGTEDFYQRYSSDFGCLTGTGSKRLALRPYINAPMPEQRIKAVFIDPKKYVFDEEGNIVGMDGCYEATIFIFTEDVRE